MNPIEHLYSLFLKHPKISTDTRSIEKDSLFFALKGANFNGNAFAKNAIEQGAAYAIIDEEIYKVDDRYILVDDVLTALQQLANHHRGQLQIPIIGITGSNGKTTSKELLHAALSQKFNCFATKGNLNNHIGVPLSLLSITTQTEIAIIEMGANHQREIAFLCEIANPNYGLICNVGKAHLEGMGGFEGVKKTKKELYDHIRENKGLIFVNGSDDHLMQMASQNENLVFYGQHADSIVNAEIIGFDPYLTVALKIRNENTTHTISTQLVGDYNLNNVLSAVCIGKYFGVELLQMIEGIENYAPNNNRSQAIQIGSNKVVMDAYNANPSSMSAAVQNFSKLQGENKWLILGDMFELGNESNFEHASMIELVRETNLTQVIFIGKDFKANEKYDFHFFESTAEAADFISKLPIYDSLILIKGSRGMKLESLQEVLNN